MTARFVDQTPWYPMLSGSSVTVPFPVRQPGDILYALYALHDSAASGVTRPQPPPGWSEGPFVAGFVDPFSASTFADLKGRVGFFRRRLTEENFDEFQESAFPCPQGAFSQPSTSIWAVTIVCVRGIHPTLLSDGFTRGGVQTTGPGNIPSIFVNGTDRLAFAIIIANFSSLTNPGNPAGLNKDRETHTAFNRGASSIIYSKASSTTVPEAPVAGFQLETTTTGYVAFTFAIPPAPVVVINRPEIADPKNLQLDCAESYEVFITGQDYRTIVAGLNYSSVEWNRILDDVSEATIDVPDRLGGVRCVSDLGGLRPWRYGIRIERNSQEVWSGPVVRVDRGEGSAGDPDLISIKAMDVLSRFQKRLATDSVSYQYINIDAGRILAGVVSSSMHFMDRWSMPTPVVIAGAAVTRKIVARDFTLSWDIIKELFDGALDAWVLNGRLVVYEYPTGWRYAIDNGDTVTLDGPYNDAGEMVYGLFANEHWALRPGWSLNGLAQGNRSWVPGGDSGEAGFRKFWTASADPNKTWVFDGVLDIVDVDSLYRAGDEDVPVAETVFQRHADSLVQQRSLAPAVMTGGRLATGAPVDMDNLRPGSIWMIDIHDAGYGQLLQAGRLKSVDVRWSSSDEGFVETVSPSIFPVGFTQMSV